MRPEREESDLFAIFYRTPFGEPLVGVVRSESAARGLAMRHDGLAGVVRWEKVVAHDASDDIVLLLENGTQEDGWDTGLDPVIVGAFVAEDQARAAALRSGRTGLSIRRLTVGEVEGLPGENNPRPDQEEGQAARREALDDADNPKR